MNAVNRINLLDLANEAVEAKKTGDTHADLAFQNAGLSTEQRAALEQRAFIDPSIRDLLNWIDEGNQATTSDAFARASWFRKQIEKYFNDAGVKALTILETIESACSKEMSALENGAIVKKAAIPLFLHFDFKEFEQAKKYHSRPIVTPKTDVRKTGNKSVLSSVGIRYLVPATPGDHECFAWLKAILLRMPKALVEEVESGQLRDRREIVRLAQHFMPQARVLDKGRFFDTFDTKDEAIVLKKKPNIRFVRYDLSHQEVLVMEKDRDGYSERLVELLQKL